jgi:hypothetical protein
MMIDKDPLQIMQAAAEESFKAAGGVERAETLDDALERCKREDLAAIRRRHLDRPRPRKPRADFHGLRVIEGRKK